MNSIARRMRVRRDNREMTKAVRSAVTPSLRQELTAIAARNWR